MSIVQKLHLSGVCIVSILNKFLVDENKKKMRCRDQEDLFGRQRRPCFGSKFVDNSNKIK